MFFFFFFLSAQVLILLVSFIQKTRPWCIIRIRIKNHRHSTDDTLKKGGLVKILKRVNLCNHFYFIYLTHFSATFQASFPHTSLLSSLKNNNKEGSLYRASQSSCKPNISIINSAWLFCISKKSLFLFFLFTCFSFFFSDKTLFQKATMPSYVTGSDLSSYELGFCGAMAGIISR
jgi:hypothetical protein